MKPTQKVQTKKGVITLVDKDYKAAGGFAVVYCKNGVAYKIYHDPKKMIPAAKIDELSKINRDDVLSPIEPIFKVGGSAPIGFTMKYVDNTEFLCKLFTRNYRDGQGISPTDIADLVTMMQKTLTYLHPLGILVVDYNEMNFLFSKGLDCVYHIDVDAWKTSNFPAEAIMASIRDFTVKSNQFTQLSDWYSWAIVTFQMYIGIHPYKGRHPDYAPKDWQKRMQDGVSVFDKDSKLPACCQDFSVIPKNHLAWYKEIFGNNDRSIPPFADAVAISMAIIRTITSKGDFVVKLMADLNDPIKDVFFFSGKRYIITNGGIYDKDNKAVMDFKKSADKTPFQMCDVYGEDPLVAYHKGPNVEFFDLQKQPISSSPAEAILEYNGFIYTVLNGKLVEHRFEKFGKLVHTKKVVGSVTPSYKVYNNVVVQDDFMKCRLTIPFGKGKCVNIGVSELDGKRIIDAKHDSGICVLMSEDKGVYTRHILEFNDNYSSYDIHEEEAAGLHSINFVVLPNGMCIFVDDEKLSLFKHVGQRKEMTVFPFDVSMRLYHDNMQVLFVDNNKLYSASMK